MLILLFFFCLWAVVSRAYASELESPTKNVTSMKGRWLFYVNGDLTKMVSVVLDSKGKTYQDCYASGDKFVIQSLMNAVPDANVTVLSQDMVNYLAELCTYVKWKGNVLGDDGKAVWEQVGLISAFFIYPGTKWCGAGNISTEYDDLGPEIETDRCCREHDYCDDHIEGFDSKHGLRNSSPFTKSNCFCDKKFYRCLQRADTGTSSRVGRIFFNFLQVECFREDYPVTGCKRYHGRIRRKCQEYEFDYYDFPIWQWFDAKHYKSRTNDEDNEIENDVDGDVFHYMLKLAKEDSLMRKSE